MFYNPNKAILDIEWNNLNITFYCNTFKKLSNTNLRTIQSGGTNEKSKKQSAVKMLNNADMH